VCADDVCADGGYADGGYAERRAATGLAATVWRAAGPDDSGAVAHRVLPDGCLDLIWVQPGPDEPGEVFAAGPDTSAAVVTWRPGARYLGLRFDSGTGPAFLGVPAAEIRDRRLGLDELWGPRAAATLAGRLARADDPAAAFEAEIAGRERSDGLADLLPPPALAGIRRGRPVPDVARAAGLSERQLRRRCQLALGYGPKTLARIVRFRLALALAQAGAADPADPAGPAGPTFADVAAATGYADQAHLAREVRALAGVPLGELLADQVHPAHPAHAGRPTRSTPPARLGSAGHARPSSAPTNARPAPSEVAARTWFQRTQLVA